jgi:hypothetical protein
MKPHRNAISNLKRSRREWAWEDLMLLLRLTILGLLVLAGAMTCAGCSQPVTQKKKFALTNPFYRDRPQRAARMTCLWEPKMLAEKQGIVRGFQGEILFFRDDKMQQSILVDGELTVYVYDADDRNIVDLGGVEGIKPLCEYKFNGEALARGMAKNKKSKIISYGVWLPIDKMPGDERHLVLWAKYEGSGDHGELLGTEPGNQMTVFLPGNPVERKKPESQLAAKSTGKSYNPIRQAAYEDINDFSTAQQSSYTEAVRAMQTGNRQSSDAIPMTPSLARRFINAPPQENVREEVSAAGTAAPVRMPAQETGKSSVGISFGGGDNPATVPATSASATQNRAMPDGMAPMLVARNRQNITSIGSQIDQRMQSGIALAAQGQNNGQNHGEYSQGSGIVQASYNQPVHNGDPARRAEIRQEMTRIMAEQEQRRRLQDQAVNAQGFTEYNANSFATDQSRVTVPDRYPSWGLQSDQSQSQGYSQPNRYPVQNPGTTQSAYVPSDWGPGLESAPSDRQTQVLYSPPGTDRTYR